MEAADGTAEEPQPEEPQPEEPQPGEAASTTLPLPEPEVELPTEVAGPSDVDNATKKNIAAAKASFAKAAANKAPSASSFLPESPCERLPEADKDELLHPPSQLVCSITGDLYLDPVVTEDGHTYERSAIEEWFLSARSACRPLTSPKTNVKLNSDKLFPNMDKKAVVIEWQEEAAEKCCAHAKQHPADAVWLLRKAMELAPTKASLLILLAEAMEVRHAESPMPAFLRIWARKVLPG